MSSTEATNKAPAVPEKSSVKSLKEEPVLQVERRDFVDLVPEKDRACNHYAALMTAIPILSIISFAAPIKYGTSAMLA